MTAVGSLLIKNALVIDGLGLPGRHLDVHVSDGHITQIGQSIGTRTAHRVIDAEGLVLAPGFIDLHTHSDFTIFGSPRAWSMTVQGVTTQLVGNCGFSPFPIGDDGGAALRTYAGFLDDGLPWGQWRNADEFLRLVGTLPLAGNVGALVGHGALRASVMGFSTDAPNHDELERMKSALDQALTAGVFGLSTGLTYAPGSAADTGELIELAQVVAGYPGAFYASHIRNESEGLLNAVKEALAIGRTAEVPVHISHLKAIGQAHWPKVARALTMIDEARADGRSVTTDHYPYTASSTSLTVILPLWALDGGVQGLRSRLADVDARERIRKTIASQLPEDLAAGLREFRPEAIVLAEVPDRWTHLTGISLLEASRQARQDPADLALDLLAEGGGDVLTVFHGQSEDVVRNLLSRPDVMIASDGWTLDVAAPGLPHPRSFGTFARVLGPYVREHRVLPLELAVQKMTSLPARRLGLTDRGVITVGNWADLVLFDAATVRDTATFERPKSYAEGIRSVVVNGTVVLDENGDTGAVGGTVLRRSR